MDVNGLRRVRARGGARESSVRRFLDVIILGMLSCLFVITASAHVSCAVSEASRSDQAEGDWLVGTWQGNIETMRVFAVSREGIARGTWFITGQAEHVARIRVEGPRITALSFDGNSVQLTHDQRTDRLVGTLTYESGQSSPVTLIRVNAASDLASADLDTNRIHWLIGKWEGEIRLFGITSQDPRRTLYIDSVSQKDGQWVAHGWFGITGKNLGPVSIEVDNSGDTPWIRFRTFRGPASIVRLQLFKDKDLIGTIRFPGPGELIQRTEPPMHLKRVE